MKFRITRYYDRFQPQVWDEESEKKDKYINIGPPNGYATVYQAREYCQIYINALKEKIVDEFELN